MRYAAASLPPAVITAVRSGLDAFVHLQRHRLSVYTGLPDCQVRELKPGRRDEATVTSLPETLCQWSDLFLLRLRAISEEGFFDPTVEVVWEFVSIIVGILEGCGDEGFLINELYVDWYRGRFVRPEGIEGIFNELRSLIPGEESALLGVVGPCMVAMQRSFLVGLFPVTARLISEFVDYLRSFNVDMFSAEEESALVDVIELLSHSPTNGKEHVVWSNRANRLLVDCKRVLGSASGRSGTVIQVAQELKSLCLDLLLMISGDATLILHMCHLLDLDVMDYVAAVCVVCGTPMTLQRMHHLFRATLDSWEGAVKGPWYVGVVEQLLGCRCVADVVGVMQSVRDSVRRGEHVQSEPATGRVKVPSGDNNIVSSPVSSVATSDKYANVESEDTASAYGERMNSTGDGNDSQLGEAFGLSSEARNLRSFSLLFMVAHVADICAPPLGAPADQIAVTFARNDLIKDYVEIFRRHPLLWRVAATYVVYSPFMDPAVLYRTVIDQTPNAVRDRYTFLSLHTFIQTSWDDSSPFQITLRRLLRDKYPVSTAVDKWVGAVDFYRQKAAETLNERMVSERMSCGNTAFAVWLALESQQSKSVQVRLEEVLRTPGALVSDEVHRVGQALSNSFISVDASQSLRMLNALQACAALFEYRKATVNAGQSFGMTTGTPVGTIHSLLHAADKVLQCAASVRMHPEVVLSVVGDSAGAAACIPRCLRPRALLPRLSNALELIFASHSDNLSTYNVRAAPIREKLMILL